MSVKAKRLFKRIISYAGIFFFILAVAMLWYQLRNYSLYDIAHTMMNIPFINLVMACCACLAGYFALSLYDFLALNYVGEAKKVTWWKWMLAGMLGFAISNNAGSAVVSGGAIRYRLYTRWRIRGGDIVKMLTLSGITYTLGCAAIVVMGYFLIPSDFLEQSVGASIGINTLFFGCLTAILAYFAATIIFHKKSVKIGKLDFQIPTTKMAILQMILGIVDGMLAGLVLYACLKPFWDIPFGMYIGLFIIAQNTGVFTQVPGGIGVFESIFLIALPDNVDKAAVFGALLAYRIIYYVLPLVGIGSLFFVYERWLRVHIKRILAEAKSKMDNVKDKIEHLPHPHLPHRREKK